MTLDPEDEPIDPDGYVDPQGERSDDPDDDTLLNYVYQEKRASVGFENDSELTTERILALEYYRGEMSDVPAPKKRSSVVSTDVADAIQTVIPDLVDIFTGGEDVATFQPQNEGDELQAAQETDYLNHVIMTENNGFMLFHTAFMDATLAKTGVFKWWWEDKSSSKEERFTGIPVDQLPFIQQQLQADPSTELDMGDQYPDPESGVPVVDFTITYTQKDGRARVAAGAPEDFTVARDTVELRDTTYCAMRSRVRAQELIAQGYDPDKVADLPAYGAPSFQDEVQLARDTAGELSQTSAGTTGDLRMTEIIEHNIRLVGDDGQMQIWRVVTGGDERVLLLREKIDRIQFSAITPYPTAHRFYGRSVADLLLEVQRIKTALTRAFLDSAYFALNQRLYVDMDKTNTYTIDDLLRNEPGIPIRGKGEGGVTPITGGGLNFDVPQALEYFATVGESRTGIVRNAQGLNPDTLHDTMGGAAMLMNNAQKRIRMIARIFAETGIKDMFLGVHTLLRTHSEKANVVRLKGSWVPVDPSLWGERDDMKIEIGVGSGGAQHEMQAGQAAFPVMQGIITLQGGLSGPFITSQNAYAFLKRWFERGLGMKNVDAVLTDPSSAQAQQAQQDAPQAPPDPKIAAMQAEQQLDQQQAQATQQLAQQKMQAELAAQSAKAQQDMQIAQSRLQQEATLKRYEIDQNIQLQREQIAADMDLKRQGLQLDYQAKIAGAAAGWGDMSQVSREPGGAVGGAAPV